jgi:MoaA/NifB/PqqE/SkfB family radical SAM enzyme
MSELGWDYLTAGDKQAILRGISDGAAYGGPFHVEMHPADRCNIDCFFCSTAALRGTDEIPMPRFVELLAELREHGTRSLRLSGGGEPLFHRNIKPFLAAIAEAGIPIENLTTNAVLLRDEVAELLAASCDQVTVSLNTADAESYGEMMQTNPRNFQRVVDNVSALVARRRQRRARTPRVNLQFLVWKGNYRTLPEMYRLARQIGADTILFNGLSSLPAERRMSAAETDEMMELYEELVRGDEYRRISVINSFEQDLSARVAAMNGRLAAQRGSLPRRAARFLLRDDFTLAERVGHLRQQIRRRRTARAVGDAETYCTIGWHSMVIRTTGAVAPCCILQGKQLGNVYRQSVGAVWYGEAYQQFRRELARILRQGAEWRHEQESDRTVDGMCGVKDACPIATFYYRADAPFVRGLGDTLVTLRRRDAAPAAIDTTH